MSQTISGYHNTGQLLVTGIPDVTISGTIDGDIFLEQNGISGYAAVAGPSGTVFTITNSALIEAPDDHGNATIVPVGIALFTPGTVINTGTIEGGGAGILMIGSPIHSQTAYIDNRGIITGSIGQGTYLETGGLVNNSGSITGYENGVLVAGGPGIILNSGLIQATSSTFLFNGATIASGGVILAKGGSVTNQAGGSVIAAIAVALEGTSPGLSNNIINAGTVTGSDIGILSAAYTNISNTGLIAGTIENLVTLGTYVFAGTGVQLAGGGKITNFAGATIRGAQTSVLLSTPGGGATVDNSGLIIGTGTTFVSPGGLYGSAGVFMTAGGAVINQAGGTIIGYGAGAQNLGSAAAFVENNGLIESTATIFFGNAKNLGHATGVALNSGGTLINAASGRISGYAGAFVAGGSLNVASSVQNAGSINGTNNVGIILGNRTSLTNSGHITGQDTGVVLGADNAVINQAGGTITGGYLGVYAANSFGLAPTLTNLGSVSGIDIGVLFENGGRITNASGGFITGGDVGVLATSASGLTMSIDNAGTITGTDTSIIINNITYASDGTDFIGSGMITNSGFISGAAFGDYFTENGFVSNSSTGTIIGGEYGVGQSLATGSLTLDNSGRIDAIDVSSVFDGTLQISAGVVAATGLVENKASGTISGSIGDIFTNGGTLINAGTITGRLGDAAVFVGTGNKLIIDPGAIFNGTVAVEAGSSGVMELVSAAATGTISGIGSSFTGFSTITVDTGAHWIFEGTDSLGTGQTLNDLGTAIFESAVTGTGTIDIGAISTLAAVAPSTYGTAIDGIAPGDLLEVAGTSVTSVIIETHAIIVTTSSGVYDFSNVTYGGSINSTSIAPDAATGLEAITFSGTTTLLLDAPATESLIAGTASTIGGLSLTKTTTAANEIFKVELYDGHGLLSATGSGITGAGGKVLTITGSLAEVNADLKTVTETELTAGSDKIIVSAADSLGDLANFATIAITASGTLGSSAQVTISAGQTANYVTISNGRSETVESAGTANITTINAGGVQNVLAGGTANYSVLAGGTANVAGTANRTQVQISGDEVVQSGGKSVNTSIFEGGLETVLAGGTAVSTTIAYAGTMDVAAGGATSGSIVFAGSYAELALYGGILPGTEISGFDQNTNTDSITLASFTYSSHDTATLGAGNVLTLDLNGEIEKLNLNPAQNYAGHGFAVTFNILDQVVIIDPIGTSSPQMTFLEPTTSGSSSTNLQAFGTDILAPTPAIKLGRTPPANTGFTELTAPFHANGFAAIGAYGSFGQHGITLPLFRTLNHAG